MRSLLKLAPYLRPYFWLVLVSVLTAIPLSAIRLGPAPLVRYILDDLLVRKDPSKLILFPAAIVGLYLLNFAIRFSHYYSIRIIVIRVNQRLKNDIFNHVLGLSADYFTNENTGTLISRTSSDPQYIDQALTSLNTLIREPLTLIFLFGYATHLNWRLTLITVLIVPLLGLVFTRTGKNLKRYIAQLTRVNGDLLSNLQESYTGIRIVKMFRLEKYVSKKFRRKNQEYAGLLLKTSLLEEISHPLVELVSAFALAPLIYYGGLQVLTGKMSAGDLFAFFTAFAMMMNPIRLMNDVNLKLHSAAASCDRIFDLLEWKSHLHEPSHPYPLPHFKDSIHLKNVTFSYPDAPRRPVLKNISFTLPKGKTLALVGASGSGKTSLVSLIPRIFDIDSGAIEIDGFDIRTLSLKSLRNQIAVVSQDIFLFNDTIEENIRCGLLSASKEKVREAAMQAHALEFIDRLPDGFQSKIGDRGQKLSGGERQRLSIARAFLREAPILLLDEATSSLDSASERAVQSALDNLMKNRTTLIIAHRLSTIRNADQILVLKDGSIVEQGVHDELLGIGGEYARFHHITTTESAASSTLHSS